MNAVHQTFAPFLASICPPPPMPSVRPDTSRLQAQCDAQAAIIKRMQPPRCPIGQIECVYRVGMLELVCHLEYEEAEKGLGDSPDLAATTVLIAAYANGMDVFNVLGGGTVEEIEAAAAAQLGDSA